MAEKIVIITDYKPDGTNKFFSIDDLPFSNEAKCMVLEWFARKLWVLLEEGSGDSDYYCKGYDPLVIEGNTAHSYVFDMEDGGRHHPFKDLEHLEKMLMDEGIKRINAMVQHGG
jgi:hypothetical protein